MKRLSLLLCLLWSAGGAYAQFNGPGLTPQTTINRAPAVTTDPSVLYPGVRERHLVSGDLLSVRVLGPGDYLATVRIEADGTVELPLIGVVKLGGLTATEAAQLIEKLLIADGMFRQPQVDLTVTEGPNATVAVIGEIHGVVPVVGQSSLLNVLAGAGGLPPTASHVITIDRPGIVEPIIVDIGTDPARSSLANVPIFPGDTIVVSKVGVVYILGAFKTQGLVQLSGSAPLTLLQVAALSGGPTYEARNSDLRIIRTIGDKRSLITVDYKKIIEGHSPDPILEPNDIVFLPSNALKAALVNGGISTLFSAVSLFLSVISYTRN